MELRSVISAALLVALVACDGTDGRAGEDELNVLFLNVDLLRADFVGLLNPASDATPHIDRFFRHGLIFEDVSAPGGETAGSSSAVLSALEGLCFPFDPAEQEVYGYVAALARQKRIHADRIVGVAETLGAHGFVTLNVNQGRRSGKHIGFDAGFGHYIEIDHRTLVDEPVEAFEEALRALPGQRFFALFHPNSLHATPYRYPLDRECFEAPPISYLREGDGYDVCVDDEALAEKEKRRLARALYEQQLRYVDEGLARIFELLEASYVDDTIVVLYANHGEGLYDNGVPFHGVPYQSCVHVPLLVRHPRLDRQVRISTPVSLIDLVPTIYDWLGIDVEHEIDGISLVPLVEVGEYARETLVGTGPLGAYVRQGYWKLVSGQSDELYDLATDPRERRDLAAEHPEVADRLRVVLTAKQREAANRGAGSGGSGAIDD